MSERCIDSWVNGIYCGDVVETLQQMPESSVHCVVTSPPYWGLRDYGVEGQIGLEDSLDAYISELVGVGEALQRVLRDDGSWWLNLGDAFAGSGGAGGQWGDNDTGSAQRNGNAGEAYNPDTEAALDRKCKLLLPHRVAIALIESGWLIRADCPWIKPNPMPNPVKDRLHEHKEFVFHLTQKPDYWFNLDAVREPHKQSSIERSGGSFAASGRGSITSPREDDPDHIGTEPEDACHPNGKNPGDVFEIPVKAFSEAHFAVFPEALAEKPIKASCPSVVCAVCGTPYEHTLEEIPIWERDREDIERPQLQRALERYDNSQLTETHLQAARAKGFSDAAAGKQQGGAGRNADRTERLAAEAKDVLGGYFREFTMTAHESSGFEQACDCPVVGDYTKSGIVLDPFAGAGTTPLVAKHLGRRFIGIDLNPDYVAMAQQRIGIDIDEPERLLDEGAVPLRAFTDGGDRDV